MRGPGLGVSPVRMNWKGHFTESGMALGAALGAALAVGGLDGAARAYARCA